MLSFMLSACLFASTSQPVSLAEIVPLADLKEQVTALGDRVRGRFLASFVKKGMTRREVHEILGEPPLSSGFRESLNDWYCHLGVSIDYDQESFVAAGAKKRAARWTVSNVNLLPLTDIFHTRHSSPP